jgi:hypothetical protein
MTDLKNLDIKWPKILKIMGLILLAILILSVFFNLIVGPLFSRGMSMNYKNYGYDSDLSSQPFAASVKNASSPSGIALSTRNVALSKEVVMEDAYTAGDAESFEVTDYYATIETMNLKRDCSLIQGLKVKDYVIFESANNGERNCSFNFKVDKEKAEEVLGVIKDLNPRELSENVQTIKRQLEDFTSREDILKNKQVSIDETLKTAVSAYDEITAIATKTNNADSLAKVIESKVNIIERLTMERININAELERLGQDKARQLDRLKYVNFQINIYENKIVDGQQFKDFWKSSVKQFVVDANQLLSDLSIGLVSLILSLVKYLIYIFLLLVVGKVCWKLAVKIWKK